VAVGAANERVNLLLLKKKGLPNYALKHIEHCLIGNVWDATEA